MAGDKKKFVTGKGMSFTKQLGFDEPELQRYDLIFVLLDQAEYDRDFDIAMSVMGSGKNTSSALNLAFVQKYVALAKEVTPTVSEEAKLYIAEQHANKRKSKQTSTLEATVLCLHYKGYPSQRLADFAEEVTLEHVKFARGIFAQASMKQTPDYSQETSTRLHAKSVETQNA